MLIVYIPGVWDLLHVGHLTILERAKSLGDRLIVGVPSDEVVQQDKGSLPLINLHHRIRMIMALRCVDVALAYYQLEFTTHLNLVRPDIFVAGQDWGSSLRHKAAEQWLEEHRRRFVRLPYSQEESTTSIRERIKACS